MRRVWLLSLAVLVAVASTGVLLAAMPAHPHPKDAQLERYLAYRVDITGQPLRVAHATRTSRPETLDAPMSASTFGSGVYYRPDVSSTAGGVSLPAGVSNQFDHMRSAIPDGLRPLPYPPREFWCIWLAPVSGATDAPEQAVLAARHQDLYNAAWVVHEVAAGAGELDQLLYSFGCTAIR